MRGGFARLSTACLLNKRSPSKNTMHTVASTDVDGILIYGLFSAIRRNVIAANSSSVCVFYLLCLAAGLLCVSSARDGERPKGNPSLVARFIRTQPVRVHGTESRCLRSSSSSTWALMQNNEMWMQFIPHSLFDDFLSPSGVSVVVSSWPGLMRYLFYTNGINILLAQNTTQHFWKTFPAQIHSPYTNTRAYHQPTVLSVSMVKVIGTVLSLHYTRPPLLMSSDHHLCSL